MAEGDVGVSPQPGTYQTTFFHALDPDVELEPHVVMIDDPRWASCVEELASAKWICLDTEFYGPNGPWRRTEIDYWKSEIRLIQAGLPSGNVLVFNLGGILDDRIACRVRHADALKVLRKVVEDPIVPKCGMALLTEYLLLRIHLGWKMRCMRDVMLMSQVIWAGVGTKTARWTEMGLVHCALMKHDLKSICGRLNVPIDKTEQHSDWAGVLNNKQKNYAARDVIAPRLIWLALAAIAKRDGLMNSFQAECDAQPAFCECEYNGLPIDLKQAVADLKIWEGVRDAFLAPFKAIFPHCNPNAPAQVAEALTDALDTRFCEGCGYIYDPLAQKPVGTPLPKDFKCSCGGAYENMQRAKKLSFFELKQIRGKLQHQPSTSDEVLTQYNDVWYVNALLEGRSTNTCMNWLRAAIENAFDVGTGDRIRADFKQIAGGFQEHGKGDGAAGRGMGRSSASRPINTQNPSNLQPLHEKAGAVSVRRCIKPRAGRSFIVADLSQAHWRIAAQWSQDPVMLRDCNAGRDAHLAMTHRLMQLKVDRALTFEAAAEIADDKTHEMHKEFKARRQGCKSTNYAKLNLSGVETLKRQMATMAVPIIMEDDEVKELIDTWNDLYKVLYQAQKTHIKKVNSHRHFFKDIGIEGEYGECRTLTNRRLYLIKEWKPPRERDDGSISAGYWSVKATDAVSFVWMGTEADLIKRAMGWLVPIFDAHPEWDVLWSNMAHDELDLDCAKEYELEVATVVMEKMDEAMRWAGISSLPVNEKGATPKKMIKADWSAK
jgi:DNA polymerase I-like protein with 3'-5' exonuclease and polymerase domains